MTKQEALHAMIDGKKITNKLFYNNYIEYNKGLNKIEFVVANTGRREDIVKALDHEDGYEIYSGPIQDKQAVYCWDDGDTHQRYIRFYDQKNNCAFRNDGHRSGVRFDYYEPIPLNEETLWMIEARKTLED